VRKSILTLSGVVLFLSSISVYGGQTIDTDCIQKSFLDSPTVTMEDLVRRDGLYFRKFSVCPFTGWVKEKTVRGWIVDGKRNGEWITFWDNGQLKGNGIWVSEVRQGPWVSYFSDGDLHQQGSFLNGEKHGSWKVYYDNPSDIIYEDGKFLSVPVESETNLYTVGQYENSKKDGPWVYYFDNGQVKKKGSYKNGTQDGPWIGYYDDGKLWMKGTFKDGKGDLVYYSPDGSVSE
jgi:antitoxin component YwqK of YwqJK toxin-antitoxin module